MTAARARRPRELGKDYHPEFAVVGGLVFVIAGPPAASTPLGHAHRMMSPDESPRP